MSAMSEQPLLISFENGIDPVNGGNNTLTCQLIDEQTFEHIYGRHKRFQLKSGTTALRTWVRYWGERSSIDKEEISNRQLIDHVDSIVDQLVNEVGARDPRFRCSKLAIGSVFDCTKAGSLDEFDYLFTPVLEAAEVEVRHQVVPNTAAQCQAKPDYFRVFYRGQELESPEWRREFQAVVKEVIGTLGAASAGTGAANDTPIRVEVNGPALTFFLNYRPPNGRNRHMSVVKVDVTLALPIQMSTSSTHHWPLALQAPHIQINNLLPALARIECCHLVPYSDLWRLSFANHEGLIIKQLSKKKRSCLIALKHLRDSESVTYSFEQSTLSSYYLKTAFLNEARAYRDDKYWEGRGLADRTVGVLNALERHDVTHYIIKDCSVYSSPHEDRSNLQARRLIQTVRLQQRCFAICLGAACVATLLYVTAAFIALFMYSHILPPRNVLDSPAVVLEFGEVIWTLMLFIGVVSVGMFLVPIRLGRVRILITNRACRLAAKLSIALLIISYFVLLLFISPFNVFGLKRVHEIWTTT